MSNLGLHPNRRGNLARMRTSTCVARLYSGDRYGGHGEAGGDALYA